PMGGPPGPSGPPPELPPPLRPRHADEPTPAPSPFAGTDLGADRRAIPIALPEPAPGKAQTFMFADEHHGWGARLPEQGQLPAAAFGGGRVYVSAGFNSRSMYALDASEGGTVWASQALEDNGPTAPLYFHEASERLLFNTESCTLFVLDAATGRKLWFKRLG